MVEEEPVVGQVGSVKGKRRPKRKQKERSPAEMVGVLWLVIDEAQSSMYYPLTTSEERRSWARIESFLLSHSSVVAFCVGVSQAICGVSGWEKSTFDFRIGVDLCVLFGVS